VTKKNGKASATKFCDIYIATTGELEEVALGATSLISLVETANQMLAARQSPIRLRTVTEPQFQLTRFQSMDWLTEMQFRKSDVMLCVIDGNCYSAHLTELFTIRAHHFPRSRDYPGFCITHPSRAITLEQASEESVVRELERQFRCKLLDPTESAFGSFVQMLVLHSELNDSGFLTMLLDKRK